ncbi:unnamed protein product [Caenorhabditis auriculariae]|uniref:Uncharacterized protein n=1 Tax=Caenorhabditis auriculariae TaxID=2777116 RepID=A0A8S1HHN7_9PELO|nr:unnamed protein product [Caenorhabditis auriculariae]
MMRSTATLFFLLAAFLVLANAQMTFTDQWSKKRGVDMVKQSHNDRFPGEKLECSADLTQDVLAQLERLHAVQERLISYLGTCFEQK